jgi:hypothetical protein
MALFRFRTRNPERDLQTDAERLRRLRAFLDQLRTEMEGERSGLRNRYDRVTADAAFSQQAFENERIDAGLSSRVDALTEAMLGCANRLSALEEQLAFIAEMRDRVETFARAATPVQEDNARQD